MLLYYLHGGVRSPDPAAALPALGAASPPTWMGRHYLSNAACLYNAALRVFYGATCLLRPVESATLFATFEDIVCYTSRVRQVVPHDWRCCPPRGSARARTLPRCSHGVALWSDSGRVTRVFLSKCHLNFSAALNATARTLAPRRAAGCGESAAEPRTSPRSCGGSPRRWGKPLAMMRVDLVRPSLCTLLHVDLVCPFPPGSGTSTPNWTESEDMSRHVSAACFSVSYDCLQ